MNDLRFALRALRHAPGFTLVVMLTLGLGLGINTAVFSVVDAIMLRPLPYAEPDRVVTLWEAAPEMDIAQDEVSAGTYRDWAEQASSFESLGAYSYETFLLGGTDVPEQIVGAAISPSVLDVVRVPPALGRPFRDDEAVAGDERVALLSDGFWRQRFGGSESALGASVQLDGQPYTIVGVMPPRFEFPPDAGAVQVWVPLAIDERLFDVRAMRVYSVVGRLAPGVSVEQARAELDAITAGIAERYPESNRGWGAAITPALEQVVGDVTALATVLAGAAALVLLLACVNVASLTMARASVSRTEYVLRAALGASSLRLVRRSLAESVSLAGLGALVGLSLGAFGIAALRRVLPADLPRVDEIGMDPRVFGFGLLAALLAGLLFGLYPAVRAARPRLADALQEGGRSGSGGRTARRVLNAMVALQVALALLLLLNAGAMLRSFARLLDVDPGFAIEGITSVALTLPESEFRGSASQVAFWTDLVDRAGALPGVRQAGAVSALPMSPLGTDFDLPIRIEGRESPSMAEQPRAGYRAVVPGYFEALGIPLLRGRLIDRFDREQGRPVMVLNESAERLLFPGEDPIGRILGVPMAGTIEIVGVVGDVRHNGLDSAPRPEVYVAFENFPVRDMHLVVEHEGDVAELASALRREIAALAPALPVTRIATMEELVSDALAQPRFNVALLVSFALSALLLAVVGIYGVVSYSVSRRTSEIGIRTALGSDGPRTFRLVVGQTLGFVLLGGALGTAAAVLSSGVVASLLYEVEPLEPGVLAGVLAVLVLAALAAAAVPALRAARVDPVRSLSGR